MRSHSASFLPLAGRFVNNYNGKKDNAYKIITIRIIIDKTDENGRAGETNADRKAEDSAKAARGNENGRSDLPAVDGGGPICYNTSIKNGS